MIGVPVCIANEPRGGEYFADKYVGKEITKSLLEDAENDLSSLDREDQAEGRKYDEREIAKSVLREIIRQIKEWMAQCACCKEGGAE